MFSFTVEKQHPVLKWELVSSATEVKEPMILDNSLSFFFSIVIIIITVIMIFPG